MDQLLPEIRKEVNTEGMRRRMDRSWMERESRMRESCERNDGRKLTMTTGAQGIFDVATMDSITETGKVFYDRRIKPL